MQFLTKISKISKILIFIILSSYQLIAVAIEKQDPVQFLHKITDRVLTEIKHNSNNTENIVKEFILPNVDFEEMCKWIAGKSTWYKAGLDDQQEFMVELEKLLTKTYASTLNHYNQETIEFQNYTGDINAKRIQIKSVVIRPDKDNLLVDYRLIAIDNSDSWKVYDLIIEGVSILQGFRAQFSDDIRLNGLKKVAEKIKNHNNNAKL